MRGLKKAGKDQLPPGLELYMDAFFKLSTCRGVGMAPGPIPWSAVDQYCDAVGIHDIDRKDDFFYVISRMDNAYLDWLKPSDSDAQSGTQNRNRSVRG